MRKLTLILAVFGIAASVLTFAGCATKAQEGALIGGGLGAGTGALIGGASGNAVGGALIGGAVGAVGGAVIGDQTDRRNNERATQPAQNVSGHYENRIVRNQYGESHEERIWVQD